MTVTPNRIDVPAVLDQLQRAEPDVLRSMLAAFVQALMSADADAACGAEFGAGSADRTNRRNGYRSREWDTRAGTIELAIPKLREGSYFPEWLLQRRKRAERALISVVGVGLAVRNLVRNAGQSTYDDLALHAWNQFSRDGAGRSRGAVEVVYGSDSGLSARHSQSWDWRTHGVRGQGTAREQRELRRVAAGGQLRSQYHHGIRRSGRSGQSERIRLGAVRRNQRALRRRPRPDRT
jgi:Transposase, Mutator family